MESKNEGNENNIILGNERKENTWWKENTDFIDAVPIMP